MFVGEKLIYLQMQKTASTHIARILADVVGGEQHQQHLRLEIDPEGRSVVGSIRSPWSWYVSLWAYGCRGGGGRWGIRNLLTQPPPTALDTAREALRYARAKRAFPREVLDEHQRLREHQRGTPVELWRPVYSDPTDAGAFRQWLRLVLDPTRARDLHPRFGASDLRHHAGFMTFRYFRLLARDLDDLDRPGQFTSFDAIREYDATSTVHDDMIRIEHLAEDLPRVLTGAGYELDDDQTARLREWCGARTNVSPHEDDAFYYDDETRALVADRERLLVDKYSYAPPLVPGADPGATPADA
ncbi:MAG TPA: hypothetical protein VFZ83_13005 [Acidimicrobiia bacterium]|nr:hypothetical protein [Acidimicrobiia bacterium]